MELADAYYYAEFDGYLSGSDMLTDNHANASIPQLHGAARMYEITGDEKWLKIVKEFWKQAVSDREAYATGGQNAGEFWIPPMKFYSAMSGRTQEFCTMYNMVRLADYLYRFTGDSEYTDYIEHVLYNAFLTQQNRFTGMPTYFLPMTPASHKTWSSRTRDFWCCSGTMVQAQTLYPSLIYYKDEAAGCLSVEQYINSSADLSLKSAGVHIAIETNMDYCQGALFGENKTHSNKSRWSFTVTLSSSADIRVRFRIPRWARTAVVDGVVLPADERHYEIAGCFDNRRISLAFTPEIECVSLTDNPAAIALTDGPVVLAAVGDAGAGFSFEGRSPKETLVPFVEHSYDTYPWQQTSYRVQSDNGRTLFVPLYDITDEAYTIYVRR